MNHASVELRECVVAYAVARRRVRELVFLARGGGDGVESAVCEQRERASALLRRIHELKEEEAVV